MASWIKVNDATESFVRFLTTAVKHAPLTDWHVIFSMGSVARVKPGVDNFNLNANAYTFSWPVNRLEDPNDKQKIILDNVKIFNHANANVTGDVGNALRAAYRMLITDGYPVPGTSGSDRIPIPIDDPTNMADGIFWMLIWNNRHPMLYNITYGEDPAIAATVGGELRRHDFMFPRVHAIISRDLKITRFDDFQV